MRNEILALLAMAMLITGGALAGCTPAGGADDSDNCDNYCEWCDE